MNKVFIVLMMLMTICGKAFAQDISLGWRGTPTEAPVLINDPELYMDQAKVTITLKDRSSITPSVDLDNARETFENGADVPKPELDRPITEGYDDLKMDYACQAILNAPYYFEQIHTGDEFTLDITFINTGTEPWGENIDVMQYSGDEMEYKYVGIYDLTKDYDEDWIVYPGESVRWTLRMRAPLEKYHDDNKYYSVYSLVKNWDRYGMDKLKSGTWDEAHMVTVWDSPTQTHEEHVGPFNDGVGGMFCPVYFYIYCPE